MGQIWSASYNSFGAITDNSFAYGSSQTTYRHGSAISYAFSNDLMALQFDAVYGDPDDKFKNDKQDPNEDLERTEFGVSVNIGEIGKVALAYVDDKYAIKDSQAAGAEGNGAVSDGDTTWRTKTTSVAGEVSVAGMTAYIGTQNAKNICTGVIATSGTTRTACTPDSEASHVNSKAKTTFFGVRGGLGDTGVNYIFQYRNRKADDKKPWILGLSKSLGGGASLHFEHDHTDDTDDPKESSLTLKVDF